MLTKEFLNEKNGKVCLHVWTPDGEVKRLYQICHGMSEYVERYNEFATYLNSKGILVYGIDHPGHGESDNARGFFAKKDGWKYMVECNVHAADLMKSRYPEKGLTLMGHSMGSFVARTIAGYYSDTAEEYVFMGTAGPNAAAGFGKVLASALSVFSKQKPNHFLESIATGGYSKAEESYTTPFDWLNTIPDEVAKYMADENCGFAFTTEGYRDLMTGLTMIDPKIWVEKLDKSKRYFLVAGDKDPVGSMGEGVKTVYTAMKEGGCKVELKLYEGSRHEILNDKDKLVVMDDIYNWITK